MGSLDVLVPGLAGIGGQSAEGMLEGLAKAQLFVPQVQRARSEAEQARILSELKKWELDLNLRSGRVYPTGFGNAIIQKLDPSAPGGVRFEFIGKGGQGHPSQLSEATELYRSDPATFEKVMGAMKGPRETWEGHDAALRAREEMKLNFLRALEDLKLGSYTSKERHGQRMGDIRERGLERTGEQRVKNLEMIGEARAKLQSGRKAVGSGKLAERTLEAINNMEAAMAEGREPSSIDKQLVERFMLGTGGGESTYQKQTPSGAERGTVLKGGKAAQFRETADDYHQGLEQAVEKGLLKLPGMLGGSADFQAQLDKIRATVPADERLAFDEAVRLLKERHGVP